MPRKDDFDDDADIEFDPDDTDPEEFSDEDEVDEEGFASEFPDLDFEYLMDYFEDYCDADFDDSDFYGEAGQ